MSKATIKKALKELSKEDLAELVLDLYQHDPAVKEYLEFWVNPDLDKLLEKYKTLIDRVYATSTGKYRKIPKASAPAKIIKTFRSLVAEPEYVVQLMLHSAEANEQWMTKMKVLKTSALTRLRREIDDTEAYAGDNNINNLDTRLQHLKQRHDIIGEAIERIGPLGRRKRWFVW